MHGNSELGPRFKNEGRTLIPSVQLSEDVYALVISHSARAAEIQHPRL
jgi:hypothetical protein